MSVRKHTAKDSGCEDACCLQVKNLSLSIGETDILKNINLHLHCGEIVALIGPNGAGKTTLMRAILGHLPYEGSVTFEPSGGSPTRPLIGYVPQKPTFDRGDPISVLDLFLASVSRWPVFLPAPGTRRDRVLRCLERGHAEALIDRRVGALSGGELQRVLLAMALEPIPHILILDEPLSGVDAEGAASFLQMLDEIRNRYDLSILLSTHDLDTLGQYADKVILLRERILAEGTPEQVLSCSEFNLAFRKGEKRGGGGW